MPDAHAHTFRRTAYSDYIGNAGVDLLSAMELIGHRSVASAGRYNVIEQKRLPQALRELVAAFRDSDNSGAKGSARNVHPDRYQ